MPIHKAKFNFSSYKIQYASLTFGVMLLATPVSASCQIDQSIYRDADGKGFELIFSSPIPGLGGSLATATVKHLEQGNLYNFNVTQSSGYGSILLLSIDPTRNGLAYGDSFSINFFDQNFQSATPSVFGRETQAPKYAFVSNLGIFDYYRRQPLISDGTVPFLNDVMWIHDRCR